MLLESLRNGSMDSRVMLVRTVLLVFFFFELLVSGRMPVSFTVIDVGVVILDVLASTEMDAMASNIVITNFILSSPVYIYNA